MATGLAPTTARSAADRAARDRAFDRRPDARRPPAVRRGRPRAGGPAATVVRGPRRCRHPTELGRGRGARRRSPSGRGGVRRPPRRRAACSSSRSAAQALEKLVLHATSLRIPIVEVEGGSLTALAGFDGHQGIALVVEPRAFATPDDILARAAERGEPPFVLVLDSLEDPQNVGHAAAQRRGGRASTASIFPTHRQAPLTPGRGQGIGRRRRAPAAGPGRRPAGRAGRPPRARPADRRRGRRRAADRPRGRPARADRDRRRAARARASAPAVRRRCDLLVRIPMHGPDRVAQRRGRRLDPAVRGRRPARGRATSPTAPVGRRAEATPTEGRDGRRRRVARRPTRRAAERPRPKRRDAPSRDDGRRGDRQPRPRRPADARRRRPDDGAARKAIDARAGAPQWPPRARRGPPPGDATPESAAPTSSPRRPPADPATGTTLRTLDPSDRAGRIIPRRRWVLLCGMTLRARRRSSIGRAAVL